MNGKKKSKEPKTLLEDQQEIIQKIGDRIKELRISQGHTSSEKFAFENEIDRAQYGRYERGTDMRISTLVRVLRALNIDIETFFSEGFKDKK
ncbi:XRE family transcriptional regulator [Paraflavitalea soli]|uniref:XRE family transcriptional regulator n=1 Tax=Paraflavitalea soli TaxID=2315862 RepID=A0A3B7MYE2_9BACT|nr:helix-turn-helix transcriptional regulator [Paraflavitalea soli]AXY78086.1 XRE family transcriptional regulator [Paraflavitalea soli]